MPLPTSSSAARRVSRLSPAPVLGSPTPLAAAFLATVLVLAVPSAPLGAALVQTPDTAPWGVLLPVPDTLSRGGSDPGPDSRENAGPLWTVGVRGSLLPAPPGIVFGTRPAEIGGQVALAFRPAFLQGFEIEVNHQWLGTRSRPSFYPGGGSRLVGILVEPPQRTPSTSRPDDPRGFLQVGVSWIEADAPRLLAPECPIGQGEDPDRCPPSAEAVQGRKPSAFALTGGFGFDLPLRAGFRLRLDARLHVASEDDVWPDPSRYRPDVGVGVRRGF